MLEDEQGFKSSTFFGPPYVTGRAHLGTCAATIIKDFYMRYLKILERKGYKLKNYEKFKYVLDAQGLPIEQSIEKEYLKKGLRRTEISVPDWLQLCEKRALENGEVLKKSFSSLNLNFDIENKTWNTLDLDYKLFQMKLFKDFFEKGNLVEDTLYVKYCNNCNTTLANAEVEESNLKKKAYIIAALITTGEYKNYKLLIATTTPETLINNLSIALALKGNYYAHYCNQGNFILGSENVDFLKSFKVEKIEKEKLIGQSYSFTSKDDFENKKIVLSDLVYHVDSDSKSPLTEIAGLHVSPWNSTIDYSIVRDNNLLDLASLDSLKEERSYKVLSQSTATDYLKKYELLAIRDYEAPVEICWRCKNALEEKLMKQWFLKLNKHQRETFITEVSNLKTNSVGLLNRFVNWVTEDRPWCVSRSRNYGTPIPIYKCKNPNCNVFDKPFAYSLEKNDFKDGLKCYPYYMNEILEKKLSCSCCRGKVSAEPFCLDVWTDSGSLLFYNVVPPFDYLMEGQDQTRGWFHATGFLGILINNKLPYRGLVFTPWLLDKNKSKLSKSSNSGVNLKEQLEDIGVFNYRSFCLSKAIGEHIVYNKDLILKEKKHIGIILNLKKFVLQEEYAKIAITKGHYEDRSLIKSITGKKLLYNEIDSVLEKSEIGKKILDLQKNIILEVEKGNIARYWNLLKEFILHEFSRKYLNTNKKEARVNLELAKTIKCCTIKLIGLCDPVLGTQSEKLFFEGETSC